ncbi:MAG TPA: DUF4265 domain-containing protein [Candidatus Binataceae bacterium]|nr:DUF4265 domain-containing protein [Candidatus Binataceae bacterium]
MKDNSTVVEVRFEIEKDADGYPGSRDAEALLCKPLDADCTVCVVASVPFYLRNVAYGDTVRAIEGSVSLLEFGGVVSRGGYSVYRMFLHDFSRKEQTIKDLLALGAVIEHDGRLIAIAISEVNGPGAVLDYILEGKRQDRWGAQDGYIFEP